MHYSFRPKRFNTYTFMNKEKIIDLLGQGYSEFIEFIDNLSEEEYHSRFGNKWTAEQQLSHIVLCTTPILRIYKLEKLIIEQKFGRADRPSLSYEELFHLYRDKLSQGGKSPEQFIPEVASLQQRTSMTQTLNQMIGELIQAIQSFKEPELDSLMIPHPLLGPLTLREMLYNAIHHVRHHHDLIILNLQSIKV